MQLVLRTAHLMISEGEPRMSMTSVLALISGERVDDRPIEVEHVTGTPYYRIVNGRHRYMAAVAQAQPTVRCMLVNYKRAA